MYIGWIKVKGLAFAEDVDGILQVCRSVVVEDDMTWHAQVDNYTEVCSFTQCSDLELIGRGKETASNNGSLQ